MTPRKSRKVKMARAFLRMDWPTCWVDNQMRRDPEYWSRCDGRLNVERAAGLNCIRAAARRDQVSAREVAPWLT